MLIFKEERKIFHTSEFPIIPSILLEYKYNKKFILVLLTLSQSDIFLI